MSHARKCIILSLVGLTSCVSVYSVHEDSTYAQEEKGNSGRNIGGVPFFAKQTVERQVSTYALTWLEVTASAKSVVPGSGSSSAPANASTQPATWTWLASLSAPGDERFLADIIAAEQQSDPEIALQSLLSTLTKQGLVISASDVLKEIEIAGKKDQKYTAVTQSKISNSVSFMQVIDYSKRYTFNVVTPLFGTATSNFKLAPDGTLSEGGGTVDTTKLADFLPISTIAEKAADKAFAVSAARVATSPTNRQVRIELRFVEKGYLYALTREQAATSPNRFTGWIDFDTDRYFYSRAAIGTSDSGGKDDKDAVQFSGSVLLPKAN